MYNIFFEQSEKLLKTIVFWTEWKAFIKKKQFVELLKYGSNMQYTFVNLWQHIV